MGFFFWKKLYRSKSYRKKLFDPASFGKKFHEAWIAEKNNLTLVWSEYQFDNKTIDFDSNIHEKYEIFSLTSFAQFYKYSTPCN